MGKSFGGVSHFGSPVGGRTTRTWNKDLFCCETAKLASLVQRPAQPEDIMSKRTADTTEDGPLKDRDRPEKMDIDDATKDMGEFEDEFEDEFESEDEIIEAGVDGRPDAEREAEEKGTSRTHTGELSGTDVCV